MCLEKQTYHQRGETSMAQGILPFKYEEEKKTMGMTALAGLIHWHHERCGKSEEAHSVMKAD